MWPLQPEFDSQYKLVLVLCIIGCLDVSDTLRLTSLVKWLTLKVLVATIDAQWEGMGDVGSARYEPALLPPCLTKRVLSYSN